MVLEQVLGLATDGDARVRFQVAFSLGAVEDERAGAALATIARRDAKDPWTRTAVLSSATRQPAALFESLMGDGEFASDPDGRALLRTLAFVLGARGQPAEAIRTLHAIASRARVDAEDLDPVLDLTLSLADGLRRGGRRLDDLPVERPGDEAVVALLDRLARHAQALVTRSDAPPDERARGVALLGHRSLAEAKAALPRLLSPSKPQVVQLAAVRALAAHPEAEVAPLLLRSWRGTTPAVRNEVLQALLGRDIWIGPLLDAVEAHVVEVGQIPPARRALLLAHKDPALRERARALLEADAPGPRREAMTRYQEALALPADPGRGRAIFERECLGCHRLGSTGHLVGPNLASVQRRTPDEILVHILDPNREVAPDFLEYAVALTDGRVVTGLIETETATSLTLKRAEGATDTILRRDVEQVTTTGQSLMPEGLETRITPREMADLIGFLRELQR